MTMSYRIEISQNPKSKPFLVVDENGATVAAYNTERPARQKIAKLQAKPNYDQLLQLLDDVSATAQNLLFASASEKLADFKPRHKTIKQARDLCDRLLRPEIIEK